MNTIALVTGANKGLGYETARRLATDGWTVLLGSRDKERGTRAATEPSAVGDVHYVEVDVTSRASVEAAADRVAVEHGRVDVLINNAGIAGPTHAPREASGEDLLEVFETNVLGPVTVTHAFLPLLDKSDAPRIVMVSSGLSSLAITSDPDRMESTLHSVGYPATKSALNMITSQYAKALPAYRVNVADPGYTATDLNGHSGFQTTQEGTDAIVALTKVAPDGPTGTFSDRTGTVPW
ncbi:MAG: SDR family NAD(P)-dependent oxidoreductase [Nocardioidaceae bacterium]